MGHLIRKFAVAITMLVPAALTVFAQDVPPPKPGTEKPAIGPFSASNFRYQLIPPSTHMNICAESLCVAGSRVSYILYAPDPNPSFERYKTDRLAVENALRERVPPGMTVTFDPPEETRDPLFTIFKARRTHTQGGQYFYVLSQHIFHEKVLIEIISSSTDLNAVNTNAAIFTVQMMLSLAMQKPAAPF